VRVEFRGQKGLGCGGVLDGDPVGEFIIEWTGEGFIPEGVLVLEIGDHSEGVVTDLPVAKTALVPFGEICRDDSVAIEVSFKDRSDFGQGVEPLEEGFTLFTVLNTAIELFTDFVRETSDFSGAGHKLGEVWGVEFLL